VPAGTMAGTYYLLVVADGDRVVSETQEGNNAAPRLLAVGGDLVVSALTVPTKAGSGVTLTVSDTTRNAGSGAVPASVTRFHLSTNGLLDASDTLLAGGRAVPALEPGAASAGSTNVTLPTGLAAGTYYIIAKADADQVVPETQEANNTLTRAVAVGPDLWISMMTVPYYITAGATISVSETVTNQGGEAAGASVTRFYLSANAVLDAGDVPLQGSRAVAALAAGVSSAGSTSVVVPAGTAPGTYFVLGKADADGVVAEAQETNNVAARVVQVSP
jgi:trimeric autotransporter adhesin